MMSFSLSGGMKLILPYRTTANPSTGTGQPQLSRVNSRMSIQHRSTVKGRESLKGISKLMPVV